MAPKRDLHHWANGLLRTMQDPRYIVAQDELTVTIVDLYPKAKYHYLVLPRADINTLGNVNKTHLDLLEHMQKVAHQLVAQKHENVQFKFGFHADPSMNRLHLHVISDDMISECLHTKMHWNSFTTDFFLDIKDIINDLSTKQKISIPSEIVCQELLYTPLKCHKCDYKPKNLPDLKRHIVSHV